MSPDPPEDADARTADLEKSSDRAADDLENSTGTTTDVEKDTAAPRGQTPTATDDVVNRGPSAQDWNGPDDPENPQNWPFIRKAYQTAVVGFLAFA